MSTNYPDILQKMLSESDQKLILTRLKFFNSTFKLKTADSVKEKCLCVVYDAIEKRAPYYKKEIEKQVEEDIKDWDFNLLLSKLKVEFRENPSENAYLEGCSRLLHNEHYMTMLETMMGMTTIEYDMLLSLLGKRKAWNRTDWIQFFGLMTPERYRALVFCTTCAHRYEVDSLEPISQEEDLIRRVRAAKAIIGAEPFLSCYNRWKGFISSKENLMALVEETIHEEPYSEDEYSWSDILRLFVDYWIVSGDDEGWFFFEWHLSECCRTPMFRFDFEELLKTHKYGKDFCKEYKSYCEDRKIEPLFNLDIFNLAAETYINKGKYTINPNRIKVANGESYSLKLEGCLKSLYRILTEGDKLYIQEKDRCELFVQMMRDPGNLDIKEHLTWNENQTLLACFVKILFAKDDEKMPKGVFTEFEKHFEIENGKLSIFANQAIKGKLKTDTRILAEKLLGKTGFNV